MIQALTIPRRTILSAVATLMVANAMMLSGTDAIAQQPQWIWGAGANTAGESETTECFFRKKFTLIRPDQSEFTIAASDRYQIYVNGQLASEGESYGSPVDLDINEFLVAGVNLITARVVHIDSAEPGLAVKFRVKEKNEGRWRSLVSDSSWKTRFERMDSWESSSFNDLSWLPADQQRVATIVQRKKIEPPGGATTAAVVTASSSKKVTTEDGRFVHNAEFEVQQVMLDSETGSLIAMEFNEFGKLLLSREGGPLLIADPTVALNEPGRIRVLCNQVSSCQGILPLNGAIYVTGTGPSGQGLYRLSDRNNDGMMEIVDTLMRFSGEPGEHGLHGLTLGPDGMIYVCVGNGAQVVEQINRSSPAYNIYEGDLLPRFEDPGGHAVGVKAPGGTVIRCSLDGNRIERVATGLRNSYDIAFDGQGHLFTHDSDMESDIGMSWYRPTQIYHVAYGACFGWRSGWAKYPEYFIDQTPAVVETGRGSPTGIACYRHIQFPARYHNTMFFADWSEGRILALHKKASGAGWTGEVEEFLSGKPLNVCDLAVGEDGGIYFCTGGRGTAGGVFRVIWKGKVPETMLDFDNDLVRVIKHPQPDAPWARQNIASLRSRMGVETWNQSITGVALETQNDTNLRLSALERMVFYGPDPDAELLGKLSADESYAIRARAAMLCGLKNNNTNIELLNNLISDSSARVRVQACLSLMRLRETVTFEKLVPMLSSTDRIESMTARRALEKIPVDQWSETVLKTEDMRLFLAGTLALLTTEPTLERSYEILAACSRKMDDFVSDRDFVDMLRIMQLSLSRGNVDPSKIPAFRARIANEFPSASGTINRELSRLMAYLKTGQLEENRIASYLKSESDSEIDRLHVAMHLQHIGELLSNEERFAIIDFLEQSAAESAGGSFKYYIKNALGQIGETLTPGQVTEVLRNGGRWPITLVSAFFKLPQHLDPATIEMIVDADRQLAGQENEDAKQARLGVIAVLAQGGQPTGMEHLRTLWREEPHRRADISIGLAQEPAGENWVYLVSSMPVLDDMTCNEVLRKLATVNRRPRDPEHYRQVIQLGHRLRNDGAQAAATLLEHWTGKTTGPVTDEWSVVIDRWKNWFETEWPGEEKLTFNSEAVAGKYTVGQLVSFVEKTPVADPVAGREVFAKAQCGSCHRCGTEGTPSGPDLTTIARRFTDREILESIIHPSLVVSDQYRTKVILTTDGRTISGMAVKDHDNSWMVTQSDGERIRLQAEEIEGMKDSDVSSMPDQLLNNLSESEVADLIAFLRAGSGQAQVDQDIR